MQNRLLRSLAIDEIKRLWPLLERVDLPAKATVLAPGRPIREIVFVERGVVSLMATLAGGDQIEVGLVGAEGIVGVPAVLGVTTSPFEAMVQVQGSGLRLGADGLRHACSQAPSLMPALLRFIDCSHTQASQLAACNGRHDVGRRLAGRLLMLDERVGGGDVEVTHEALATMLGVRRPGITEALGALGRAALVRHRGGVLQVVDRAGLTQAACECHALVGPRCDEASHGQQQGWTPVRRAS